MNKFLIISLYAKETCCIDDIHLVLEKCAFLSVSYQFSTFVGFGTFHKKYGTFRKCQQLKTLHFLSFVLVLYIKNPIILCNVAYFLLQRCNNFKSFLESERSEKITNVRKRRKRTVQVKNESVESEVKQIIENPDLTDKQRLFCVYYSRCFNATKAYQKAYGCSYETAMVDGSSHLRNPKIKSEILKLKQERLNREFLSEADIFQKYMDIAFADITDYVEFGIEEEPVMSMYGPVKIKDPDTGEEKQLTQIVNTVRFKESTGIDGTILTEIKHGRNGSSIKLADRMKALEWLSKHMDLGTEEQRVRIEQIKIHTENVRQKLQTNVEETADDGFL